MFNLTGNFTFLNDQTFIGWDFVGNVSGTAKKPMRDVPIALMGALVLVTLTYTVPLISAISVLDPDEYTDTLFVDAAAALWPAYSYVISTAAFLGLLGLGTSFMSTSSEALA